MHFLSFVAVHACRCSALILLGPSSGYKFFPNKGTLLLNCLILILLKHKVFKVMLS